MNFLLSASEIAASLGLKLQGLAKTIGELCEPILELQSTFKIDRSLDSYERSYLKDSQLSHSLQNCGLTAELSQNIDAISAFGHSYGMVFQIIDDILDLTATDEEIGKPSGNDLLRGSTLFQS